MAPSGAIYIGDTMKNLLKRTGLRSVLFGVHHWYKHPRLVAKAWELLYGKTHDPRMHLLFFVHDLGYIFCDNMDDERGERHVEFGANIMRIFGDKYYKLALYHSRFYAKRDNVDPSLLCYADKLSYCLEDMEDYIKRAKKSGEVYEYLHHYFNGKYFDEQSPEEQRARTEYVSEKGTDEKIRYWFYNTARWIATYAIRDSLVASAKDTSESSLNKNLSKMDRYRLYDSMTLVPSLKNYHHTVLTRLCVSVETHIARNNENFSRNASIYGIDYGGFDYLENREKNLYTRYRNAILSENRR